VYNACNGYASHVVRRLYRDYPLIGSTSSTRTAATRSCQWLPPASVPCPALPFRPMCVEACVCLRVRACACVCDASAYAAGTRRGRLCRSGSRRCSRSAPRCCGRLPPPGTAVPPVSTLSTPCEYSEYPVSTQSTPAARAPHRAAANAHRHPERRSPHCMGSPTPGTEWAHPVPDLYHEQGSARARSLAGTGLGPCQIFSRKWARPAGPSLTYLHGD
jgi:hypothetical protein